MQHINNVALLQSTAVNSKSTSSTLLHSKEHVTTFLNAWCILHVVRFIMVMKNKDVFGGKKVRMNSFWQTITEINQISPVHKEGETICQ